MAIELSHYPQPTASSEIELQPQPGVDETNDGFSLPPTDGGRHAWLLLFACFMLEALIWGMRINMCSSQLLKASRVPSFLWHLPGILQHT